MGEPTNGVGCFQTRDDHWVQTIKEELKQQADSMRTRSHRNRKIYRVRPDLRRVKPEHYDPDQISLGLFDRFSPTLSGLEADRCRRSLANAFLGVMGLTIDQMDTLCDRVVPNPIEVQDFYGESGRDNFQLREVQWALTLDAIFVTCLLAEWCGSDILDMFPTLREAAASGNAFDLRFDLLKVENQIPLSLLRNVLLILVEMLAPKATPEMRDEMADETLTEQCLRFTRVGRAYIPGFYHQESLIDELSILHDINFVKCEHLLDCLHQVMCHGIGRNLSKKNIYSRECTIILPTVTQLHKAGIEFQGVQGNFHELDLKRRGWLTCTLYLPLLSLWDQTELIWRNLVAYEDFKDQPGHLRKQYFTNYIHFMDQIIESENDVDILKASIGKSSSVIYRDGIGGSKQVAHIFNNSVLNQANVNLMDDILYHSHRHKIMDFYNQRTRRLVLDCYETYFGKPWLTVSVIAAGILLLATLFQTYYSAQTYYITYHHF